MTDINTNGMLVIQTDFGKIDGAVAAMYGIALGVNPDLKIYDLTHDIPPFNIFQASYRLFQSVKFWPSGTVFVSVVDPGVGSQRDSIIVQTETNHFLVTPDNGALTHLKEALGIKNIWKIDQEKYMRKDTGDSNTFHGRDLYAPVGAMLASGKLDLDTFEIKKIEDAKTLDILSVNIDANSKTISGNVDTMDAQFGNLWTNITNSDFKKLNLPAGTNFLVKIKAHENTVYSNIIKYGNTFADVDKSEPIIFLNSVYCLAIAINQGNFVTQAGLMTHIGNLTIEFKAIDL